MKRILILLVLATLVVSCEKGRTTQRLNGNEPGLPPELKGLKVYTVTTGALGEVKVAVLNNQVNSLTYAVGKTTENVIIINSTDSYGSSQPRTIMAKEVLFENSEIIIVKK